MPPDGGRPRAITVHAAHKALCDAGVISPDEIISKIIIELDVRKGVVLMHVERLGDERLLKVLPAIAHGAEVTNLSEEPAAGT